MMMFSCTWNAAALTKLDSLRQNICRIWQNTNTDLVECGEQYFYLDPLCIRQVCIICTLTDNNSMFNLFVFLEVIFDPWEISLEVLSLKIPLWILVLLMLVLPLYQAALVPTPLVSGIMQPTSYLWSGWHLTQPTNPPTTTPTVSPENSSAGSPVAQGLGIKWCWLHPRCC